MDELFAYLEEDMDMTTFLNRREAIMGKPIDWESEVDEYETDDFPNSQNTRPIDLMNSIPENPSDWQKSFLERVKNPNNTFPLVSLRNANAFNEVIPIDFVETENDPVKYDALSVICPNPFEKGKITDFCQTLLIKTARHYSRERNIKFIVFVSMGDGIDIYSESLSTEDDPLPLYIHPKQKIGTFAPLVILDAPLNLEKPFEMMPDGKLIFTDGCGVRIKDIPGLVLNNCFPGSDDAVYSIDYSPKLKEWSLYKCRKIKREENFIIEIEKVGRSLTVQELNSDPGLANILYSENILFSELNRVNICLDGSEAIALGLPIHNGNF